MGVHIMFELNTISLVPSYICNLKCKFCNVRVPYLRNLKTHTVEEMMEMTGRMFKIVDHVHSLAICGGEILLYKDLPALINELMKNYKNQFDQIEIITNGTIVPSEDLISAVKKCGEKFYRLLVDDYGKDLSKKVPEIVDVLEKNQIEFRVNDYWSENMWYDGWTDFGTFREYLHTPEEAAELYKKCFFSSRGFHYAIYGGIADPCRTIQYRINAGLEVNPDEYIDLFDNSITIEQQREKINRINNATYLDMCRYCNGLYPGCKRIKPAEQLTPEELQQIRQDFE